jgi:hypothetical protein
MELNNGGSHVSIETVYHKNLVLRGHSFTLVTKLNSINLDWLNDYELGSYSCEVNILAAFPQHETNDSNKGKRNYSHRRSFPRLGLYFSFLVLSGFSLSFKIRIIQLAF